MYVRPNCCHPLYQLQLPIPTSSPFHYFTNHEVYSSPDARADKTIFNIDPCLDEDIISDRGAQKRTQAQNLQY